MIIITQEKKTSESIDLTVVQVHYVDPGPLLDIHVAVDNSLQGSQIGSESQTAAVYSKLLFPKEGSESVAKKFRKVKLNG